MAVLRRWNSQPNRPHRVVLDGFHSALPFVDQAPLYNRIDWSRPLANSSDTSVEQQQNTVVPRTPLTIFSCPSDIKPSQQNIGGAGTQGAIRDPGQATSSYCGSVGAYDQGFGLSKDTRRNGYFHRESSTRIRDVIDGTSNTIVVGETTWRVATNARIYGRNNNNSVSSNTANLLRHAQWKMNPLPNATPAELRNESFHSLHEGGVHFLFGDGSVKFVSENIQHTAHAWTSNNPFDVMNAGAGFGVYQRLHARNDNLPVGEF